MRPFAAPPKAAPRLPAPRAYSQRPPPLEKETHTLEKTYFPNHWKNICTSMKIPSQSQNFGRPHHSRPLTSAFQDPYPLPPPPCNRIKNSGLGFCPLGNITLLHHWWRHSDRTSLVSFSSSAVWNSDCHIKSVNPKTLMWPRSTETKVCRIREKQPQISLTYKDTIYVRLVSNSLDIFRILDCILEVGGGGGGNKLSLEMVKMA